MLTATQFRELAEEADGRRGANTALAFEFDPTERKWTLVEASGSSAPNVPLILTDHEPGGLKGPPPVVSLNINGENRTVPSPGGFLPDAIFLSQSAVEKFVLPYYANSQTPEWLVAKKEELFGENVVAVIHIPPSRSIPFDNSAQALGITGNQLTVL